MKKYRENREMMHAADVLSSVLSILDTIPLAFVVAYSRVELGTTRSNKSSQVP